MDRRFAVAVAFAGSLGAIACGDKSDDTTAPSYSGGRPQAGLVCSFNTMKNDVNSYFAVAARPAVQDLVALMKGSYGPNATSTEYGFDILRKIADAHRLMNETDGTQPVGTAADGSKLANDVIGCMGTISPMPTAITDFAPALSTSGAFDVRGDGTDDQLSIFTLNGTSVIKPPAAGFAAWTFNTLGSELLFYAAPVPATFVTEAKISNIGFSWNTIPERHVFTGDATLGMCIYSTATKDRIQEVASGVARILPAVSTSGLVCNASLVMAPTGIMGRVTQLARKFIAPSEAYAGQSGGGTGGLLGGLSNFGVGIVNGVTLAFGQISDGVTTDFLPPFTVTATTSAGSKFVAMKVFLTVVGNSGSFTVYQGTDITSRPFAYTDRNGVATFSNVRIDKPGGYTFGVSGADLDGVSPDYTALLQNSKMFHIKQ